VRVEPAAALGGHLAMPGDKSVSHRAVLVGAITESEVRVEGFGRSADTEATIRAVRALGVEVDEPAADELVVHGRGLRGLAAPSEALDCGNAGTLMRLLPGILAGQEGRFELVGDASLSARPMERIAEPLRRMGARVETSDGRAPLVVEGGRALAALDYKLPVASAQVKSAVLLAGLYAERGRTTVVEPVPTRDHTELLLQAAGARVTRRPHSVSVFPAERLALPAVRIPGDFSAAAPFLVAAVLLAGSSVTVHGVGLNPRRTGLLDALERMGARVAVYNRRRLGVEPGGDVEVHASPLVATTIGPEEVPRLVDELPLLALAAGMARGETVVRGAGELRVKESDRIERVVAGLRGLGVRIVEREDGFAVRGVPTRPRGGSLDTAGDHRLAMLGAVAGLVSREGVELGDASSVAISSPGFFELLDSVTTR
jgi:3-phosphoshikimate 1-carboxyvinyltransferase